MRLNRHIAIIGSRLDEIGGYEKIIPAMANLLQESGNKVSLLIFSENEKLFHPVNPEISVSFYPINLGITPKGNPLSRKWKMLKDIRAIKNILHTLNPDILITTEYHFSIAAVLARRNKSLKIISWEHSPYFLSKRNRFWETLFRKYYPKLDAVICQNETEVRQFSKVNSNALSIPNFINTPAGYSSTTHKQILTVARLVPVKGIDLLLTAAKDILHQFPDWKWKIIGDGEWKEKVIAFIQQNNLKQQLMLEDPVYVNLSPVFSETSIYACTSRKESFGLSLAEAMSYGIPAVSFDCESGPRHIITHMEDGILVEAENTAELSTAIIQLITNDTLRKTMGEKAKQNLQRFSPLSIYSDWETVFKSLKV